MALIITPTTEKKIHVQGLAAAHDLAKAHYESLGFEVTIDLA